MGRYLNIAKGVSRRGSESAGPSASLEDLTKPNSENAWRLLEAGWTPKVSFGGQVIWERPDNGFYFSEEAAICVLEPRKTQTANAETHCIGDANLPNDFGKKGAVGAESKGARR